MKPLKNYFITGFLFVSILGTLSHFFYDWSGNNPIVGLFSPVNESTWEHMKLLFFPAVVCLIFLYIKLTEQYPNLLHAMSAGILAGTFLIPVLFYTYTGILGRHLLPLDIAVFLISTAATFFIAYRLTVSDKNVQLGAGFVFLLIVLAVLFPFFTYLPPSIGLFAVPL
ncbi:MAG: hypothetical protein KH828_10445 [Clostridiales bacterium]|nr:hypothetical protein [Clostridiales bacterium]